MKTIKLLLALWAIVGLSSGLANDPWALEALELSAEEGIQVRSPADALASALGVNLDDLVEMYAHLEPEYVHRLAELATAGDGAAPLTPGKPLYVNAPLRRDAAPPTDERLRRVLADKAKRFLTLQGLTEGSEGYARWLELAQAWYWRDTLAGNGPRYVVPLFNPRGECVAVAVVNAWKHPGSVTRTLTSCPRNYAYLNQEDARKRLAEEGLQPARTLRALAIPVAENSWPIRRCSAPNTVDDRLTGVWTDGVHAVGVASGNVYRLTRPFASPDDLAAMLRFTVRYAHVSDEDPRWIAPRYPGFLALQACGDPKRSDYVATRPLERVPASATPAKKRNGLLDRQIGLNGADQGRATPEEARKRLEGGPPLYMDLGTLREMFGGLLPRWADEKIAPLPDETPVRKIFHLTDPYFVRSLLRLPVDPANDPLVRLMLDEVARAELRKPLGTPSASLEDARQKTWAFTRAIFSSRYYAELVDDRGRCVLAISTPAATGEGSFGDLLTSCRSSNPVADADAAAARFREAGIEPQGELEAVLIFYQRDPRTPTCPGDKDTMIYPYWSDGRYALNGQSGNLYRLLPQGLDYLTQTPEPYPAVFTTPEGAKFLAFFLPVRLEAIQCTGGRP